MDLTNCFCIICKFDKTVSNWTSLKHVWNYFVSHMKHIIKMGGTKYKLKLVIQALKAMKQANNNVIGEFQTP